MFATLRKPLPTIAPNICKRCLGVIQGNPKPNDGVLFKKIDGSVDNTSGAFQQNKDVFHALEVTYKEKVKIALSGGGPKSIKRHVEGHGKMLPEDKVRHLIDHESQFLELGQLAGLDSPYGHIPRGSSLMGIGKIHGLHTVIAVNDGSVKGGTMFPITLKKNLRAQEIAMQNKLPIVYLIDSGGAFLPLQAEIFPEKGGRTFYNEAIMSAESVPQLAVICGSCTAGGAYLPVMAQENVMVNKLGSMYLGGPPLVYAALGEIISSEALGGAMLHCSVSGCTDHYAESEAEAYETSRNIVSCYNMKPVDDPTDCDEPLYDPDDLPGLIPADNQHSMDMYKVISRIVDGSRFQDFKTKYGKEIITGFCHIQGWLVGIVANNGVLTEPACNKASHFVQLCNQRRVPIIFLQNTHPPRPTSRDLSEATEQAVLIRAAAKFMTSVANVSVPKLTVVVGNSLGVENYIMCGRSFDPNFMFLWPNAKIGISDPEQLIAQLSKDTELTDKQRDHFQTQMSAFYSTSLLNDDGVILPQDTRKMLGKCLSIVHQVNVNEQNIPDNGSALYRM